VTVKRGNDLSTLPLRWLGVGAQRGSWLALADLERFEVGGVAGVNTYASGVYSLQLGNASALSFKLDLPGLLPIRPVKEFPDVIERPGK